MKTVVLVCVCVLACAASAQSETRESRTVQTTQGPVRGYKNDEVFEFLGIPYATAPTGPNRFTAPLPGPIWINPLEAVNNKIVCPQGKSMFFDFSPYSMQENCLVANIYMPDTEDTNLPVMVYVHGGAYQMGWGEMINPKAMVKSKKIVTISFNYRLGIHGFLCLGTEGAPGNAGMKDQVALLHWVQKNIANFGGNPKDVTIVGSSAGSSAVDLLMLSEMTKGLYNKVIPESGANVGVWSVQLDPLQNAKDFARANNFTKADNIHALEQFYKTASFELLTSDIILLHRKDSSFVFSPCVELNIGQETFLEDNPVNILKQGKYRKVPVLYGFANMEGLFRIDRFEEWKKQMNERFSDFLPADLAFKSEKERNDVAQVIKEFYFGDKPVSEETVQAYIDYFTDVIFAYPHLRSADLQVKAGSDSIYLYEYNYYTPPPKFEGLPPPPKFMEKIRGANHCAQSWAVYDSPMMKFDVNEEYQKIRENMQEIWLNFITTGKPVPEGSKLPAWPPVGADRSPHMELGKEFKLKGPLLKSRARFWDDIYERYYRSPVPPPTYSFAKEEL